MFAQTGIGLREFEIHLLQPCRQRVIRLLKDGGSLVKVMERTCQQIVVRCFGIARCHRFLPPAAEVGSGSSVCSTAAIRRTRLSLFSFSARSPFLANSSRFTPRANCTI